MLSALVNSDSVGTNTTDLRHDITRRLFTAEPILKTRDEKKNVFAATPAAVSTSDTVACIIDAVTPDKNVAMVVISKYRDVLFCCAVPIIEIPGAQEVRCPEKSPFKRHSPFSWNLRTGSMRDSIAGSTHSVKKHCTWTFRSKVSIFEDSVNIREE